MKKKTECLRKETENSVKKKKEKKKKQASNLELKNKIIQTKAQ